MHEAHAPGGRNAPGPDEDGRERDQDGDLSDLVTAPPLFIGQGFLLDGSITDVTPQEQTHGVHSPPHGGVHHEQSSPRTATSAPCPILPTSDPFAPVETHECRAPARTTRHQPSIESSSTRELHELYSAS